MKPKPWPAKRQTREQLVELQRLMAGKVMQPLTGGRGMRRKWHDGRAMKDVAASFVKPNDRLTSFERLEIYNRQYWFRVMDCFFDDYPGMRAILGEQRFERMAVAYLSQHPSESFTLRNLGRRLVEFLETNPRWVEPLERPALDMARLEWAHIEAFDNEAKPTVQVDSLLDADPAALRLGLQPHLTLLQLGYEVDALLLEVKHGGELRREASNAMEASPSGEQSGCERHLRPKTIFLAVHRHDDTVYYKRLEPGQFRLLSALQVGATLAKACETLVENAEDFTDIKDWFETWARLGWFCNFE